MVPLNLLHDMPSLRKRSRKCPTSGPDLFLSIAQLNSDNNKVGALMLWGALGVGSIPMHFRQRKSKGITSREVIPFLLLRHSSRIALRKSY
jgi:hypothetical protein